jgi:iron complex outermembrane recepter protein
MKSKHAITMRTTLLLGASALSGTFAAAPAAAQMSDEATVDSNTIIVTAQRRSQALEDVPMSITVVTPETLAASGVNNIRDLQNVTTGFQIGNGGSYPQPAIRGITTTNAGNYENNVAVFVDGLYQTTPQVLNMDLPNVQAIQILKGPQGALYGRNATGGALLLDTVDPGDIWTGNLEATYGRFDDRRARGFVAGPITEGIGISVAGTLRHTDGYYKIASRTTPGEFDGRGLGMRQESVRTKLKLTPVDSFRVTLGYNYTRANDPRGVVFTPIENVQQPYQTAAGVPVPGNITRPRNLGEVSGDIFTLDFKQHEGLVKLEWDTGIGTLRSVTGYARGELRTTFDFAGSYVPDNYSDSIIIDKTWQENIDLTIDAIDNLDIVLGGNYYNIKSAYDDRAPNSVYLGPASLGAYPDPAITPTPISSYRRFNDTHFFRTKEAWAIFGDVTFQATDRLSLNVGARYSKETQDVSGYKVGYSLVTGQINSCAYSREGETRSGFVCANGPSARTSSYPKFTPRASIRYEIAPGTNAYASYSRGFRGGEWNSVIPGDNPNNWLDAKQETVDAFEIGLKSAGRRLRFDLSAFYYDYKDLQVSFTQFVGGVAQVILQNAPKAKIYGAEANFDYEVVDNVTIRGGATWLNARYGDRFFFTGSGVNPNLASFNAPYPPNHDPLKNFQNTTAAQDLSGLQMARAPDFTGFLGFDYLIPQGEGGFRFAANVKYTTSYAVTNPSIWGGEPVAAYNARLAANPNAAPNNNALLAGTPFVGRSSDQRARQGAHALLNASITWTDPTDHFYIRIWGNNLTDIQYRTHYNPLANGTYAPIGEPMTFGGTVGAKF